MGWEGGGGVGVASYHLQHWHDANEYDDPGGALLENGYFVQCAGDCEDPQPCGLCGVGCCWWETSGVMSVSYSTWTGWVHQVNFTDDEIGAREFACVDLSQGDLEDLWSQLPDEVELPPKLPAAVVIEPHLCQQLDVLQDIQDPVAVSPVVSALPLPLSLLCGGVDRMSPIWDQLQGLSELHAGADSLVVYTDGSL